MHGVVDTDFGSGWIVSILSEPVRATGVRSANGAPHGPGNVPARPASKPTATMVRLRS